MQAQVCMYVYTAVLTHMHAHTHTHTHTCMHAHTHTHVYMHKYVDTHIFLDLSTFYIASCNGQIGRVAGLCQYNWCEAAETATSLLLIHSLTRGAFSSFSVIHLLQHCLAVSVSILCLPKLQAGQFLPGSELCTILWPQPTEAVSALPFQLGDFLHTPPFTFALPVALLHC